MKNSLILIAAFAAAALAIPANEPTTLNGEGFRRKETELCTNGNKLKDFQMNEQQCRAAVAQCAFENSKAQNFDPIAKCMDQNFSRAGKSLHPSAIFSENTNAKTNRCSRKHGG